MKSRLSHTHWFWILWLLLTLPLVAYFYSALTSIEDEGPEQAGIFLPNATTHGHHQIEMACSVCHTEPFGGKELIQDACMNCHAAELERVEDSHPQSKFTDPRNADILANLDARYCIACHVEHKPDMTHPMGVTLPDNFCFHCHADVGENRPTHKGLDFTTCATGGCHNFHDNKALYEDFLIRHASKPANLPRQTLEAKDLMTVMLMNADYPKQRYPMNALEKEQADAPHEITITPLVHEDWFTTKHAQAGVNCTACHEQADPKTEIVRWVDKPNHESCQQCHQAETTSFKQGKHGMRLDVGLSPMTPAEARLPMNPQHKHAQLSCTSCHTAHRFDPKQAATESCLQCHTDQHSQSYPDSPHAKLWHAELKGEAKAGTGVSCATCHMPRIWFEENDYFERILVDHNQNNTLRPNDKMLRPVCMQCHGLGFAIDALADPALIKNNFNGQPSVHVESIDMALEMERRYQEKRRAND